MGVSLRRVSWMSLTLGGVEIKILVDAETRSEVLARFFDGQFILGAEAISPDQASEVTQAPSAN
jgi:hypothetical protein